MTGISSAFSSEVFTIYAGPSQKKLIAHASVLCKSPILRKAIEGEWKESRERVIYWNDFDEHTVDQLLEWLYSAYYTWYKPPPIQPNEAEGAAANAEPQSFITSLDKDGDRIVSLSPHTYGEGHPLDDLLLYHQSVTEHPCTPREIVGHKLSQDYPPTIDGHMEQLQIWGVNDAVEMSYRTASTLLPDAKLYVLAQYLQMSRLRRLAFRNIQHCLMWIGGDYEVERGSSVLANVIDLIRYVYASTDSLTHSIETLRKLVSAFVADRLWVWRGWSEIEDLMREGGDFVVDVTRASHDATRSRTCEISEERRKWKDAVKQGLVVVKLPLRTVGGQLRP